MVAKILAVDDEPDLEVLVMQRFRREISAGEFLFRFAGDGEEALAALKAEPDIDLLLLDLNMPAMDGFSLLERLQQQQRVVKAIIVSAYGDIGNFRRAMTRGAVDFVTKPIDFDDLERTIRKTLADIARFREIENFDIAHQLSTVLRTSALFGSLGDDAIERLGAAFEMLTLAGGTVLFRQDDPADSLYIVISGLLEVSFTPESQPRRVVAKLGAGEFVGEMGVLDGEPRAATVAAIRDTQLAKLPRAALDVLLACYPQPILSGFLRQLSQRLRQEIQRSPERQSTNKSVAVVPLTEDVDAASFCRHLTAELARHVTSLHVGSDAVDRQFGLEGFAQSTPEKRGHTALSNWLAEQAQSHRTVIYEADFGDTAWTARSLRQADLVLLLVPRDGELEQACRLAARFGDAAGSTEKPRLLIVLHQPHHPPPAQTRRWLAAIRAERHFHIRPHLSEDFGRLARFLAGRAVGLVLGGGFARGLAHIGVIRAMREMAIPIDMVGGTSMGAIISGQCAVEWDCGEMLRVTATRSAAAVRGDYTLPLVSLLTGRKFSNTIAEIAGGRDIEDAWLPCFCVSASLTDCEMKVHTSGDAARSIIASARVPVMFPPISFDNHLLVDGGLINNVPASVMKEFSNHGFVISVDVSSRGEFRAPDFGTFHSGWKEFRRKLNGRAAPQDPMRMLDILMRVLELGRTGHANPSAHSDIHLVPPLGQFSYRDFGRAQEMAEIGYRHAKEVFEAWILETIADGVLAYDVQVRPTIGDLMGLPAWLARPRFNRHAKLIETGEAPMVRMIAERLERGGGSDILAAICEPREDGKPPSAKSIRDQAVTLVLAGHVTMHATMLWTLYLLARHPKERARLEQEVDTVLGGRRPDHQDVAQLPYTRMVLEEAMRLYPPIYVIPRLALASDRIADREVPKGANIVISPWLLHRNPKLWQEPSRFIPDRFDEASSAARQRFSYIPFGAGQRICVGAPFAMVQTTLILASIVQSWRLDLPEGHHVEPVGLVTLRPRDGMTMRLQRREPAAA